MMRALFSAASGMVAQQRQVDNIANNIANVGTTGFKRGRTEFQDLLYQTIRAAGAQTETTQIPVGIQAGLGVRTSAVTKLFTEGALTQTGNRFDLAIEGEGFFHVIGPDNQDFYSRDGSFKRDRDGAIVTADGFPLDPAITIDDTATNITITPEGIVSATLPGQVAPANLGTITLTRFPNPAGLSAVGRNLFQETDASGAPVENNPGVQGSGLIQQGFLENSNVQVVEEIVDLIIAQRAFEASSNVITASDEMLQVANNARR